MAKKKLTSAKAKEILHDKSVHGHPLTDQQRKFFGAIAGGAKPYKAEEGGWLDKYEQGGMVLKQKTKDNYGTKPNVNDDKATYPDGFVGMAYNTKGRNYSPAWGGQFAMGGALPGATGMMYARTINPAPSNGPYAKKTKASAQDGKEVMKGEDFVKGWMNSPMYNQMLSASATGEEYDRISKGRVANLSQPRLITSTSTLPEGTRGTTSIRVRTPFNATFQESEELMNALQKSINNPKDKDAKRLADKLMQPTVTGWDIKMSNTLKPGTVDYESVLAHEIGHTTDRPLIKLPNQMSNRELRETDVRDFRNFIPVLDMEKMSGYNKDKLTGDFNKYVADPSETRQFLNDVRYLGKQQGVYDPFTQKITPEQYRRIKSSEYTSPMSVLSNVYTEDQIIDMLNSISKRQSVSGGVPTAQNGQEMKYYQEGLDFTPKTISQDGSKTLPNVNAKRRKPIIVSDPKDPRLKAYRDSLSLHNLSKENVKLYAQYDPVYVEYPSLKHWSTKDEEEILKNQLRKIKNHQLLYGSSPVPEESKNLKSMVSLALSSRIRPQGEYYTGNNPAVRFYAPFYKKPVQPVVYQPEPEYKPRPRIEAELPRTVTGNMSHDLPKPKAPYFKSVKREDKPTKFSFTYPTGEYNQQKTMYFPSKSALKSFTEGVRGATYQEGADYATATGNLQDGGDIPVDPMGYWNPENVGGPVIIPSNVITMEGVDQPLLGISDTGDIQYMEPGEDYEFDGEYVTEYPVAKGGVSVNNADAQPLKKLDQLLNFTNYNKPTKGGWLDKYQ